MAGMTCSSVLASKYAFSELPFKLRPCKIKAQLAPEPGRRATLVGLGLGSAALLLSTSFTATAAVADHKPKESDNALVGGWTPINPKDPDVVRIAKYAVNEHNKEAGTSLSYISVVKAERQVVAGFNYRLVISAKDAITGKTNNYMAIVWSQLSGSLKLTSFEELLLQNSKNQQLIGGWTPIQNLSDPEVLKAANFAVSEYNKVVNETVEFVSVVKGESQVVSGIKYKLLISAKGTISGEIRNYEAVVWSQPWKDFLQLISFEEAENESDPIVGGYTPIKNLEYLDIVNIAKFAVTEHNIETGESLEYIAIIKGYQQVVAGMNYKLVIITNDVATNNYNVYQVVVWSKPWEKFLQLISFEQLLQG